MSICPLSPRGQPNGYGDGPPPYGVNYEWAGSLMASKTADRLVWAVDVLTKKLNPALALAIIAALRRGK
jgi:hypothetical protein